MNRKQKICLWIGIAAIVLMGLFPPWVFQVKAPSFMKLADAGYAFITNAPHYMDTELSRISIKIGASIDLARLAVQWVIVAIVTGGLVVTFEENRAEERKDKPSE